MASHPLTQTGVHAVGATWRVWMLDAVTWLHFQMCRATFVPLWDPWTPQGQGVDMPSYTCYLLCLFVSKVNLPLLTSWKWYLLKDSDLGRMPGMWCTSICLSPTFSLCWILLWALAWFTLVYRYYFSGIVFCQTLPNETSRSKEIS